MQYTLIHTYTYMYIHIHTLRIHFCVITHTYTHTHTHTPTHTFTHTHTDRERAGFTRHVGDGDYEEHINALQHTATHCNTLQHTATHCNTPFFLMMKNTLIHLHTYIYIHYEEHIDTFTRSEERL